MVRDGNLTGRVALVTGAARRIGAAIARCLHAAGADVAVHYRSSGAEAEGLSSPAHDPFVIAVAGVEATDDGFVVPDWASRGDDARRPDVAAPGAHVVSLRAPGSDADVWVGDRRRCPVIGGR